MTKDKRRVEKARNIGKIIQSLIEKRRGRGKGDGEETKKERNELREVWEFERDDEEVWRGWSNNRCKET